jgi:hypothetical protein
MRVGIDPDSGDAMLVISDDLDWSDPVAHINALQAKIGAYLGFIQTGQFEAARARVRRPQAAIAIIQQFEPPDPDLSRSSTSWANSSKQ